MADLCPVFSTEAPPPFLPGTGTGVSDDDGGEDSSPTSSPTSSPSERSGERGHGGGHGKEEGKEGNLCFVQEMACMADAICEACVAGATLDGSCDRDASDCAGVADFYCCVAADAGEECGTNALLLEYVSKSLSLL